MTQEPVALGTLIGYQLKEAQSILRARMDETLRPLGLTTPQYVCLELLRRNPGASNSELARHAFVTRQTMSTLLRGLQDRGLVERPTTAPSGRSLPTRLTADGDRLLDAAWGDVQVIETHMVSRLSAEQRAELHAALASCIDALHS
ncbi:MarR family winged helix-turn-helix transcriptional regulator [Corynebacterium glyciniphilum]|uniref:HTH marR-type domain-containing protein n=1 Tax=Corynebacterium glyciniphilum AJ 3170 TaxID=1404245 RepID=X5DNZ8_9CORY|nr:MarR family transcriptional regulator [Corynebacterium glyciniphilum]AHW63029.1 hypothetical protein CGLY_02905 [Corynebacterium glyciniphilum AJ 3170]